MPAFDTLNQFGRSALRRTFGQTVTRHPQGNPNAPGIPVEQAVFTETRSRRDEALGFDNVRYGQLHLPTSVDFDNTDSWTVAGDLWLTHSAGPANGGFRTIHLFREEQVARRPNATPLRSR